MADKENPARGGTRGGVTKDDCSPARTATQQVAPAVCPRNGTVSPAARLTAALGGTWQDQVGRATCPLCERSSLSITDGDKSVVVRCDRGCDRRTIVRVLRHRGQWPHVGRG
jgi:hypothetical protein